VVISSREFNIHLRLADIDISVHIYLEIYLEVGKYILRLPGQQIGGCVLQGKVCCIADCCFMEPMSQYILYSSRDF